jgi:hypothetical protein
VCHLPPVSEGEGNTRWRERGWESPNSDEGHTLWYSLYVRTLWVRSSRDVDEIMRSSREVECLAANAKVAKVLGSIPLSSDTVESEGRKMKQ